MPRKRKFKEPRIVTFKMELEQYEKLELRVPSVSEFLRKMIDNYLETSKTIYELKLQREAILMEQEELSFNLEMINQKINEIKGNQKENENNQEVKDHIIEIIQIVMENEYQDLGIPKERIDAINKNQLTNNELKKLIRDNNIRVIKPSEKLNSKIVNSKIIDESPAETSAPAQTNDADADDNAMEKLINIFNDQLKIKNNNNVFSNISAKQYLQETEKIYQARCTAKGINFNEFKALVLS